MSFLTVHYLLCLFAMAGFVVFLLFMVGFGIDRVSQLSRFALFKEYLFNII